MKKIISTLLIFYSCFSHAQLLANHDARIYFENCQDKLSAYYFLFNDGENIKLVNYFGSSSKPTIYNLTATPIKNGYKFEGENSLWIASMSETAYRNYQVRFNGHLIINDGIYILGERTGQKTPTFKTCPDNSPAAIGLDRPDFHRIRELLPDTKPKSNNKSALGLFNFVEKEIAQSCQKPRETCAGSNNYKLCLDRINASHCY